MKIIHLTIYGTVQGVCYRADCKRKADSLEIKGFVKNIPNNTIEIICTGEKENIDKFIMWCKQGPEIARVTKTDIKEIESKEGFNNFEIRY